MAHLTFWGKPGCAGNAKQMALLRASGHTLDVRDLSAEPWTAGRLRAFFGDWPVAAWFNRSASKVKTGAVRPETLTEAQALALLLAEPLLIRRPLLQGGSTRVSGFDPEFIADWIGLSQDQAPVGEGCPRPDMQPCQHSAGDYTGV